MVDSVLGATPSHLTGDPYVLALRAEVEALMSENKVLHARLESSSEQIDALLSQNLQGVANSGVHHVPSMVSADSLKMLPENSPTPPPPPPPPPTKDVTRQQNNDKVISSRHQQVELDPLVLDQLNRLRLVQATGRPDLKPETLAERRRRKQNRRKHENMVLENGTADQSRLYEKVMNTSPMKEVLLNPRNLFSNMSHVAKTKPNHANLAHEIMVAATVAERANVMREKTMKKMTFGRRASEACARHGYQLLHHNLGADAFMGESYGGNLSPYTHAATHQQEDVASVRAKLNRSVKTKRVLREDGGNNHIQRGNASLRRKAAAPVNTAFGRRVSVMGGRSSHLVTHHLLGPSGFMGESYNAYHSTATGRMDVNPLNSPPTTTQRVNHHNISLEEIAEEPFEDEE